MDKRYTSGLVHVAVLGAPQSLRGIEEGGVTDEQKYFTMKQVAAMLGASYPTISTLVRCGHLTPSLVIGKNYLFTPEVVAAIKLPEPKYKTCNDEDLARLYRAGKTLSEIGTQHNLTRERVRQRLKRVGISKHEGGASIKKKSLDVIRAVARKEQTERTSMRQWNLSVDDMAKVRASLTKSEALKLCAQYKQILFNAHRRKIPFLISFSDYVTLMKPHVTEYGRGGVVLHRIDPDIGYENRNVVVLTHSESSILGKREQKISDLHNRGYRPSQIGNKLGIKPKTVSSVLATINTKLKFTEAA